MHQLVVILSDEVVETLAKKPMSTNPEEVAMLLSSHELGEVFDALRDAARKSIDTEGQDRADEV